MHSLLSKFSYYFQFMQYSVSVSLSFLGRIQDLVLKLTCLVQYILRLPGIQLNLYSNVSAILLEVVQHTQKKYNSAHEKM